MSTSEAILSLATAAVFLIAGGSKLSNQPKMLADAERFGLSQRVYRLVGGLEAIGAAGVLIGLFIWSVIGVLACIGLLLLMLGAIAFHLRAKDSWAHTSPAILAGAVTIGSMIAQLS